MLKMPTETLIWNPSLWLESSLVPNTTHSWASSFSNYTVIRIDGRLHQPHRMAPDQTIRVMEYKFDICDGHFLPFWSFPITFPFQRMEIPNVSMFSDYISIARDGNLRCFEDFRLYSLFQGWKFPMCRCFLIIFPLQRMEIPDVSKISDYIPSSKDGNPRCF